MTKTSRWTTIAVAIGLLTLIVLAGWRYGGRDQGELKFIENGTASWYGPGFHGKETASGERYNQNDLTAAHKKLPLGSEATVTNIETGKSVEVEINDRGPYVPGRKIDLSKEAARRIGVIEDGTAKVRIEATAEQLDPDGDGKPGDKPSK
jgi:rare lipoprotein A